MFNSKMFMYEKILQEFLFLPFLIYDLIYSFYQEYI